MPLRRRRSDAMRDLLYLSETKMKVLTPQVPDRIRRRLGAEAGVNAGLMSLKATLASDSRQSSTVGALQAVVSMIEAKHGRRQRSDADLRVGDWIQIAEEFRYGDAWPGAAVRGPVVEGLVYFAAVAAPPLLLVGSAAHVLDRRPPEDPPRPQVGVYYTEALRSYAQALRELPDGAAHGRITPPENVDRGVAYAVHTLCDIDAPEGREWTSPVRLAGLARVIGVWHDPGDDHGGWVLATPLYLEYAPR
ncbi:SAVMC3_10250 family protein [Streptomyces sp. NPDC058299]|uniref:SAVMC3_10250 family protein n=1 Tax=Streptomyces sp. NPDC058299 TaxID=3346435 RepID=UPI0036E2B6AF